MKRSAAIGCMTLALASAAFAHSGVKNPAVKARMDAMSDIGAEMKILGQMAKGELAFDQSAARAAAALIAKHSAKTPALFKAREDDPKSEAKAAIWGDFSDFAQKSQDLTDVASNLSTTLTSQSDLGPALKELGKTCKACHALYRAEK